VSKESLYWTCDDEKLEVSRWLKLRNNWFGKDLSAVRPRGFAGFLLSFQSGQYRVRIPKVLQKSFIEGIEEAEEPLVVAIHAINISPCELKSASVNYRQIIFH